MCIIAVGGAGTIGSAVVDILSTRHARLSQATRLASAVPAFEIRYPRNYACLQAVRAAIVDHAEHQL